MKEKVAYGYSFFPVFVCICVQFVHVMKEEQM